MEKSHSRCDAPSDTQSLSLHVGANFSSKCLLRDKINGAAEHVFQVKQNSKILRRRSRTSEADQNINVTVFMGRIARGGAG